MTCWLDTGDLRKGMRVWDPSDDTGGGEEGVAKLYATEQLIILSSRNDIPFPQRGNQLF